MTGSTGIKELTQALNIAEPSSRVAESPYGRLHYIEEHLHKEAIAYPSLSDAISLTAGTGAWSATGAITEIVPASTITDTFDIHFVNVSSLSANGQYEIFLYQGGAGSEVLICQVLATRNAIQSQEGSTPTITPKIDANTRISARLASGNVAADTAAIKIIYHTY